MDGGDGPYSGLMPAVLITSAEMEEEFASQLAARSGWTELV